MSTPTEPLTIPRVIHQIWYQGESAAPPQYRKYRETWLKAHPTWEHRFWDETACRALLAERYPEYLPKWEAYPVFIQRIDAIRYFILDTHGGVYMDMDMECLRPLDPLLAGCDLLLSRTVGYNNAAFAGIPDHPLFRHARATLLAASPKPPRKKLLRLPGSGATAIAETAGPRFFSRMVEESGAAAHPRTKICPGHTFEPRAPTLVNGRLTYSDDLSQSYAIHYEDLSWLPSWHRVTSRVTRAFFKLIYSRRGGGAKKP